MDPIYSDIREHARAIVSRHPAPEFYKTFSDEHSRSVIFMNSNPVVKSLYKFVEKEIENDFGHGIHHALKVAIDAGTLILIEGKLHGWSEEVLERTLLVVQSSGLLHDIRRKSKNHAMMSAVYTESIIHDYPFSDSEVSDMCQAIRNHEAFKETIGSYTKRGKIISDCLYDADKFRWGPDNFTHTVWDMVTFSKIPPRNFIKHYPKGIATLEKIKDTFRSGTGKIYGPEFIDIGISIGDELFNLILKEYPNLQKA